MITLRSAKLMVGVVAHGARIARLLAPDRAGRAGDVVLGLAEKDYPGDGAYLGATVGRFANRIAAGRFVLDGREHRIPLNEPGAALHGGPGFDHADFVAGPVQDVPGGQAVTLRHHSPDGDGGFPGALDLDVTYTVDGADLHVHIRAITDAPTVVNLTNHAYFALGGPVVDHLVQLFADRYLPVGDHLIPTGELAPVAGTPFDLRSPTRIGDGLAADHPQLTVAGGYDHTLVLGGAGVRPAAHVVDPVSGRTLTVLTDQPGVQFYSGNMLDGSTVLHDGRRAGYREAFCLEPQHFPDSPNQPTFPTTVLRPGETRHTRILFRLGTTAP